jgi:hypothetical protein
MIQFERETGAPPDTISQKEDLWSVVASRDPALWDDLKRMNNVNPVRIVQVRPDSISYEWKLGTDIYTYFAWFEGYGTKKTRAEKVTDEPKPVSTWTGREKFRTQKNHIE